MYFIQRQYFSLTQHWVDAGKRLRRQLRGSDPHSFYFGVKFYAADPCKLLEEITRWIPKYIFKIIASRNKHEEKDYTGRAFHPLIRINWIFYKRVVCMVTVVQGETDAFISSFSWVHCSVLIVILGPIRHEQQYDDPKFGTGERFKATFPH